MRPLKQIVRKIRVLKFFVVPLLALAFEIWRWKRQSIPHRAIFCSALVIVFVLSLIWWQSGRTRHKHYHLHRHRRQDDYR